MSCKVSVIIPVYNAAKYINKIADCLLSQTLKDMGLCQVKVGNFIT